MYNQSNHCGPNPFSLSAVCDVASSTLYFFHSVEINVPTNISIPIVVTGNLTINAPLIASSPREFWSRRWNMLFKQVHTCG